MYFDYDFLESPNFSSETAVGLFSIIGTVVLFFALIGLVLYILRAVAVYKMSKTIGFKNCWLAFIPIANAYVFGKVAHTYVKRDGKKSANFGIILLIFSIFVLLVSLISLAVSFNVIFEAVTLGFTASDLEAEDFIAGMLGPILSVYLSFFLIYVVALAYKIVNYVALWRIFSLFDYKNATLYTVLSIFIGFLEPVFLLIVMNNTPAFEYSQRMGYYTENY